MSSRISRKWGRNRTFRFWRLCSWALNLSMENSFFAQNQLIAKIGVYLTPWKYSSQWQLAPLSPHWAEWVSASLRSPGQITHSLLCGSKTRVKGNEWRNLGLQASKPQLRACADQKFQSAQPAPHLWSHSFCYLRLFRDDASLLPKIRIYMEWINSFFDPLPRRIAKGARLNFPTLSIKGSNWLIN